MVHIYATFFGQPVKNGYEQRGCLILNSCRQAGGSFEMKQFVSSHIPHSLFLLESGDNCPITDRLSPVSHIRQAGKLEHIKILKLKTETMLQTTIDYLSLSFSIHRRTRSHIALLPEFTQNYNERTDNFSHVKLKVTHSISSSKLAISASYSSV